MVQIQQYGNRLILASLLELYQLGFIYITFENIKLKLHDFGIINDTPVEF